VTKSPDPLDALRRANERPLPKREVLADQVRYDYYSSHPEHRRRPTRRLRRRLIRED
jgi:hypothetical protein